MPSDFNSTRYPLARKSHWCDECARTINAGERYSRTAAIWEGEWFTNTSCLHCAIARYLVDDMDDWYSEVFYGGLAEWLGDHWFDSIAAARLKVCADRKWERFGAPGLVMPLPAAAFDHPRILRQMGHFLEAAS